MLRYKKCVQTLLCLKWMTAEELLYSTWNSAQCYVAAWMGGGSCGRMDTRICMTESLSCSPEAITALLIAYTLTQKFKRIKKHVQRFINKNIHFSVMKLETTLSFQKGNLLHFFLCP